jgi:membrane-bound serine protease (ClpP class)
MMLGAVMLIDSPLPEMRIHWSTAVALTLPFSAITVLLLTLALRARRAKAVTGSEAMVGEVGAAITELAPAGTVFVHGEYWDAASTRPVAAGAGVRVTAIDKLKLTVEPMDDRRGG